MEKYTGLEVAVIGLSGRFPMAADVRQFWENLKNGKDCVSDFSEQELLEEGEQAAMINDPHYIRSRAYVEAKNCFDAEFFQYRPDEAELMDPQLRIFHECCWEAIEDAGYDITNCKEKIGLFAAATSNLNWELYSIHKNKELLLDDFSASLLRDVTFLASRIAYRMNLKGPAVFSQTACSSSLVAIHQACSSLLLGECNMALAGGITINNYSKKGYLYREGMIYSRDGRCRPFDAYSSGTVAGEGAGVAVLKKLKDAIRDGDHIYGIVKGSAINNDGSHKIGYTAPGIPGQSEVIMKALKMAAVGPATIGYVEAHGTATELGDPVEIAALKEAYARLGYTGEGTCGIGSVKSNMGHMDNAAGIAGFIKALLSIRHRKIVPTLHYSGPNKKIDFAGSPFYVADVLKEWKKQDAPLRAGVSSFGIGGTNAHIILEEAPLPGEVTESRGFQLMALSARSHAALERNTSRLLDHMNNHPEASLPDISYTLLTGRAAFDHRKIVVGRDREEIIASLSSDRTVKTGYVNGNEDPGNIVFMFPGQGTQYSNMCRGLYEKERVFREKVEECLALASTYSQVDLRRLLFPDGNYDPEEINHTENTQPALFVITYSLACQLMEWGIKPHYMIGHSIGEYVAACISGVFTLADALRLVIRRGQLMGSVERGAMLSIDMEPDELMHLLSTHDPLDLAVINSDRSLVVAGATQLVEEFGARITSLGRSCKKIYTSHAFHSRMMDGILEEFRKEVAGVQINPPLIPYLSNLTGKMAVYEEICRPSYWSDHLRHTVQFAKGAGELLRMGKAVLLEVGPGRTLCNLVESNSHFTAGHTTVNFIRQSRQTADDQQYLVEKLGSCWLKGIPVNWESYFRDEQRQRVSLPAYSFEKTPFTANIDAVKLITSQWQSPGREQRPAEESVHIPSWQRTVMPGEPSFADTAHVFVVFSGDEDLSLQLIETLKTHRQHVIEVRQGTGFKRLGPGLFEANITDHEGLGQLFIDLERSGQTPDNIIYCLALSEEPDGAELEMVTEKLDAGYIGLCCLARALGNIRLDKGLQLNVVGNYLADVMPEDKIDPLKTTLQGPARVIPLENLAIQCKVIDIPYPFKDMSAMQHHCQKILNEVFYQYEEPFVAYRAGGRWIRSFHIMPRQKDDIHGPHLKEEGVYIVAGGTGGIGLTLATHLACEHGAEVIMLHRTPLPKREDWEGWLTRRGEEDPVSRKILRLMKIENMGGRLNLYQVDVTVADEVEKFALWVRKKHPVINGLIWAAGEVDTGGIILNRDRASLIRFVSSKIQGLLLFRKYLGFEDLDFVALCASIGNTFHQVKFGQVAYNAANEFLESFALFAAKHTAPHVLTIQWSDWMDVGITVDAHRWRMRTEDIRLINSRIEGGITPREGITFFLESLRSGVPVSIIFKGNLQDAILSHRKEFLIKKASVDATPSEDGIPVPSTDDLTARVMDIFTAFFPGKSITPEDNFFELGGDSLKGMTLTGRLNKGLGINITISEIYQHPTAGGIAAFVSAKNSGGTIKGIPKTPHKKYYALSSAQKRIYFLQMLNKESTLYNETQLYKVTGPLQLHTLEKAFADLIRRHEGLRTVFVLENDTPEQCIVEEVDFRMEYYRYEKDGMEGMIQSFVRPFDLGQAPLCRVGVAEIDAGEYLVMIDLHHIIADGVSQRILLRDLMALYNGERLSVPEIEYKDYAEWQQGEQQLEELKEMRRFWMDEFSGEITSLNLPADRPRPVNKTFKGDFVDFEISRQVSEQLNVLAAGEGASLFMVLLAAYNILLTRLSGREDIVVGTPVAGRQHNELENVVGMFVNTIPLRNFPKGTSGFRQFLSDLKTRTLACWDRQAYQFETLIEDLKIQGSVGRNPLFDVMFSFKNMTNPDFVLSDLNFQPLVNNDMLSRFDLTLWATEYDGRIQFSLQYSTELFDRSTIERFVFYFRNIMDSIIADADQSIACIDILSEQERDRLLRQLDNTCVSYPQDKTISHLFEEQVKRTPDRVAVKLADHTLTYAELHRQSEKLAVIIRNEGVQPDQVVGLLTGRSIETVIGMLAILKAGGAYLPIDAEYPEERRNYLIKDSGTAILLITEEQGQAAPPGMKTIIIEDALRMSDDGQVLVSVNKPSDLCYVIYTSGTTGNPKGVMVEHRNVVRLFFNGAFQFDFGPTDVWTMFHSHCFDFSVWEMYGALLFGGRLIIIPRMVARDTKAYLDILRKEQVTVLNQTPCAFYNLIQEELQIPETSLSLKYVIFGGEALSPAKLRSWRHRYPAVQLINMFGITETTVHVTYKKIEDEDIEKNISNVGKPIPTLSVYVLDAYQQLAPEGVMGELYVGGAGVARGYLGKKELTEKKFVPHPYDPGQRLYRSGDWARILPTGDIEYIGRMDHQVQLRGFRIELGEIENKLNEHEFINESVVLAGEKDGDKYLVAYYISDTVLGIGQMRQYLKEKLPDHMIPSYFVHLQRLPLTSNGKLDRSALPSPEIKKQDTYIAPSNDIERRLVEIWSDVLKLDKTLIGIDSNFFEIGGQSLKAVGAMSKIEKEFKVKMPLLTIFVKPTIRELSTNILISNMAKRTNGSLNKISI